VDAAAPARNGIAGRVLPVSDRRARRRTALKRTAKPCGPGTRCWCQVGGGFASPTGFGKTVNSSTTVTRTNSSPGRARHKSLKPLRAGMPGDPGATVVTTLVCYQHTAHEAAGATGTRHSPRPLLFKGERFINGSGASRRGVVKACLMHSSAPHLQLSSPAKAGDPVIRGISDGTEKPRRTGYPAYAGYDSSGWSGPHRRHCEEQNDEAIHSSFSRRDGLLRLRSQ
jgi:hypothetical protein